VAILPYLRSDFSIFAANLLFNFLEKNKGTAAFDVRDKQTRKRM
jgi:hypothetical protein